MSAADQLVGDRVVGPLREARRPLFEGLQTLQAAAQAVGDAEAPEALARVEAARAYLEHTLLPALNAEEFTLFIAVSSAFAHPEGTAVMSAQHRSIQAMAADLGKVAEAAREGGDVAQYRRYLLPLLFGLYALIRAHLEAEDDAYLPLLDDLLSESQVEVIVTNLARVSGHDKPGA